MRAVIQVIFFITAPGLFSAAFSGARYILEQMGAGELVELSVFVKLMLALLAYTIVFSRFFCGYACAFGTLGDALYGAVSFLRKQVRKKKAAAGSAGVAARGLPKIPERVSSKLPCIKYILLAVILGTCFFGYYSKLSPADPWELFASFTAGSFSLKGSALAAAVLGVILVGMCCVPRFFCRFLCPMGAIFALMPVIPVFVPVKDKENCIKGCSLCRKNCPAALSLEEGSGECFQCGACLDVCPKQNVAIGLKKLRGTEIPAVLLKAALLFAICWPWI